MNRIILMLVAAGMTSACTQEVDLAARADTSRTTVKTFAQTLQGELKAAIEAGGPPNAISVCHIRAPAIASELSAMQGWTVGRTSAKARNPENRPDAWEAKVLADFEMRKAAGEDPSKLEFFEVVTQGDEQQFRYMKAIVIPENAPCLACHGTDIAPAVAEKLQMLYPDDPATGYKAGDIRGAFTIIQPL